MSGKVFRDHSDLRFMVYDHGSTRDEVSELDKLMCYRSGNATILNMKGFKVQITRKS